MVQGCFSEEISWKTVITEIIRINYVFATDCIRKILPKLIGIVNWNLDCYIYIVTTILSA